MQHSLVGWAKAPALPDISPVRRGARRARPVPDLPGYIIQEWIKLPGAWWSPDHIETMLALRLNRANREWEVYWRGVEKETA